LAAIISIHLMAIADEGNLSPSVLIPAKEKLESEPSPMMTIQLRDVVDRAARLPEVGQDAIAHVLSSLLDEYIEPWPDEAPALSPDLDAIIEESMRQNAALLDYLKDK